MNAEQTCRQGCVRVMPRQDDSVCRVKGELLEKQIVQPVQSPRPKLTSLHRWLTALVFVGSGLVYLSLVMQSALIFLIGELVCVITAPFVLWIERGNIRQWWDAR